MNQKGCDGVEVAGAITLNGGQLVANSLSRHGVDRVFCVPGESYLALLDALHDTEGVDVVPCRHEGGAAMMAEADAKLTGRPGVCMVTRGPGATNASSGLHVALQDSTPMILLVGQVPRDSMERGAFQEIDYRRMFGEVAKWVAQVENTARIQEFMARAFAVATSGRSGPVVLALPEDVLSDVAECFETRPRPPLEQYPAPNAMAQVGHLLAEAERPLMIVGGSGWDQPACDAIQSFAERSGLPVATSFRRQDHFDNAHPNYVGDAGVGMNPKLRCRIQESDLLMVVGSRFGDIPSTSYTNLTIPVPRQTFIHVHAAPEELGRVYQPHLAIAATPRGFAAALADIEPVEGAHRKGWLEGGRSDYEAWQCPAATPGSVQMGEIMLWLRDNLARNAIVTNGAGNFAIWVHRFLRFRELGTQLAPTSGSMGYGYPAAVAAKLRRPDRTVLCVAGDGDFLMTGQELATAVQFGAAVIVMIVDNGMYGTIRMHQERHFPERVVATSLRNPDFVALAHAYGAHGELVERTEDFPDAFRRCEESVLPSLIHLKVEAEAISPTQTISDIRKASAK